MPGNMGRTTRGPTGSAHVSRGPRKMPRAVSVRAVCGLGVGIRTFSPSSHSGCVFFPPFAPACHAIPHADVHVQKGVLNLIPLLSLPSAPASVPPHKTTLAGVLCTLVPLSPSLALCLLFISSTSFTESISASKYPRGYAAYRSRVAMFVPFLTPVWGALLSLTGGKREVEELVWGEGAREAEVKDRVKAE